VGGGSIRINDGEVMLIFCGGSVFGKESVLDEGDELNGRNAHGLVMWCLELVDVVVES
nr:hypothetical protein [Tanacetum cinerariifolium]